MTIEKLDEFASSGDKHLEGIDTEIGFVASEKPERQWFNYILNALSAKANEMVDILNNAGLEGIDGITTDMIKADDNKTQTDVNALKLSKVALFGSKVQDVLYRTGINYESRAVTPETADWTPQYDGWNNGIVEKIESRTWYHDYRPTIADGADFNTDGCNFFMGPGAGNLTMKPDKAAIGDYKLHCSHNYGIGLQALGKLTTGYKNTAFGTNVGRALTEGYYNTGTGRDALHNCTIGNSNTMNGMTCGYGIVEGSYNSNYGTQAGYNNKNGSGNTKIGARSGFDQLEGDNNIYLGYQSARGQLAGIRNIIIGYQSTNNGVTTASYNTIIGSMIVGLDNVSYQTVLADGAGNISYLNNPSGTKAAKHDVIGRDPTVIDLLALDAQQDKGTTVRVLNTSNGNSFAQVVLQSRVGQAFTRLVAWGSQNAKLSLVHNSVEAARVEVDSSMQIKAGTVDTPALASNRMMGFELAADNSTLKIKIRDNNGAIKSVTLNLT